MQIWLLVSIELNNITSITENELMETCNRAGNAGISQSVQYSLENYHLDSAVTISSHL